MLRSGRASVGNDGGSRGSTTLSGCSTPIECAEIGRKSPQQDRSHKPRHEANGGAQCGKSARCVRRGGGWRRGMAETPRPRPARQSSTLLGRGCRKSAEFGNSPTPYSTVLSRARSPDGASSVLVL